MTTGHPLVNVQNPDAANQLTVYLAEFNSRRNAILSRFDAQRQAFNYLFAVAAVFGTLVASGVLDLNSAIVALLLPLAITPVGFIFFDNELMIWHLTFYVEQDLRPKIYSFAGDVPAVMIEGLKLRHLSLAGSLVQLVLSFGRWVLFVLPPLAAVLYLSISLLTNGPATTGLSESGNNLLSTAYWGIFVLDWIVTLILLMSAIMCAYERLRER